MLGRLGLRLLVLMLAGAGVVGVPAPSTAAIPTVTSCGDTNTAGQLRTLIAVAAPGDTIVVPTRTITLAGAALSI